MYVGSKKKRTYTQKFDPAKGNLIFGKCSGRIFLLKWSERVLHETQISQKVTFRNIWKDHITSPITGLLRNYPTFLDLFSF